MGTKWRNSSSSSTVKRIAFLMAVVSISAAILIFQLGDLRSVNYESILFPEYQNSSQCSKDSMEVIKQVIGTTYSDGTIEGADFRYYLSYGAFHYSNSNFPDVSDFEKDISLYYYLKEGKWTNGRTGEELEVGMYVNNNYTGFVALPKEYIDHKQEKWEYDRSTILPYGIICLALMLFGLLNVAVIIYSVVRHPQEDGIGSKKLDKVYSDVQFLILILDLVFIYGLNYILRDNDVIGLHFDKQEGVTLYTNFQKQFLPSVILLSLLFLIAVFVAITVLLSLIRKQKAGNLIKQSLSYRLFKKSCDLIKRSYRVLKELYLYLFQKDLIMTVPLTKKLYYRQWILGLASTLMFALAVILMLYQSMLILIPLIAGLATVCWFNSGNNNIYEEIDNHIQVSLNERMKSERTKIALITNVSHDLKTPLTSIVSYIELLSKEEGLSDTAHDYIQILQSKSDRLKNIVNDLFELAKSTSGDVRLDYEKINLQRLMEQTLVEMGDKINALDRQIKTIFPTDPVNIKSDGKRLYRVLQNVIDNALKYSMKDTRIFINLEHIKDKAIVSIKNTANYEMNFNSEEIVQRFVRGDQARSEEGSGLGLSIAESFARVCGGNMNVLIEGDVFQVIFTFDSIME